MRRTKLIAPVHVPLYQAGGELAFKWRGASLQGELIWRREDHPEGVDNAGAFRPAHSDRSWGGYAQAGYFVVRHLLQVAGRFGYADDRRAASKVYEGTLPGERLLRRRGRQAGARPARTLDERFEPATAAARLDFVGRRRSGRVRLMGQVRF